MNHHSKYVGSLCFSQFGKRASKSFRFECLREEFRRFRNVNGHFDPCRIWQSGGTATMGPCGQSSFPFLHGREIACPFHNIFPLPNYFFFLHARSRIFSSFSPLYIPSPSANFFSLPADNPDVYSNEFLCIRKEIYCIIPGRKLDRLRALSNKFKHYIIWERVYLFLIVVIRFRLRCAYSTYMRLCPDPFI